MGKHLLLTVGTNPLPVLIAGYRLYQVLNCPPITLFHSPETREEAAQILRVLGRQLRFQALPNTWRFCETFTATSPRFIFESIEAYSANYPADQFHLHYTGGTKAMVLHAMRALSSRGGPVPNSYLDVTIHAVMDENDVYVDPAVVDERVQWRLSIEELANLHGMTTCFREIRGFEAGPHCVRTDSSFPNPSPEPDAQLLEVASTMLRTLRNGENGRRLSDILRTRNIFRSDVGWPRLPNPATDESRGFVWPVGELPSRTEADWSDIPDAMNRYFAKAAWMIGEGGRFAFGPEVLTPQELEVVHCLMCGGWLELAVYQAIRRVFDVISLPCQLHHSVRFAKIPLPGERAKRNFEVDVAVILGYQFLLVSCTTSSGAKDVKQKGLEAVYRARQIGGDGSRALVVCTGNRQMTDDIQEELADDIGSSDLPLQIWHRDKLHDLENSFMGHFKDQLRWGA